MQSRSVLCLAVLISVVAWTLGACSDDAKDGSDAGAAASGGSGAGSGGTGGSGGGTPDSSIVTGLPDNTAGKTCTTAADCGGATCASQVISTMLGGPALAAPGGYCTTMCMTDAECGAGGACIGAIAGALAGSCLATCTEATDCRDGYVCGAGLELGGVVILDTCRPAPETDQLGDDAAGRMCETADDCAGGTCLQMRQSLAGSYELPGGYCSGACLEDAHCGAGGVCLAALLGGAGSCYEACSVDTDCVRDGYRCRPLLGGARGCDVAADPLPDNTTGKPCTSDADCGGAAGTCMSDLPEAGLTGVLGGRVPATGGYCSQTCAEDIDCGAGGACAGGELGAGTCLARCSTETDCREGYACEDRATNIGQTDAGMMELNVCAAVPTVDEDGGV